MTNYLTKKNQPIKAVTHQEIYRLQECVQQLASWEEPLKVINMYFKSSDAPLNKKKLVAQYHAMLVCSKPFMTITCSNWQKSIRNFKNCGLQKKSNVDYYEKGVDCSTPKNKFIKFTASSLI